MAKIKCFGRRLLRFLGTLWQHFVCALLGPAIREQLNRLEEQLVQAVTPIKVSVEEPVWMSVKADIDNSITILEDVPPFRVALDLSTLNPGERMLLRVECGLPGRGELVNWVPSDSYEMYRTHEKDGRSAVQVNGQLLASSLLVTIPVEYAPWPVRFIYTQLSGVSRVVKYIMYRDRI